MQPVMVPWIELGLGNWTKVGGHLTSPYYLDGNLGQVT